MTILLTTHYHEEADRLASKLATVDRGRVVAEGSPDGLKSQLRGDTVQVELVDSSNGAAAAAVGRFRGVGELNVDGRLLRAPSTTALRLSTLRQGGSCSTSSALLSATRREGPRGRSGSCDGPATRRTQPCRSGVSGAQ